MTVTYNSAAKLRNYWSKVVLPSSVEWIVVDNASTDDSAAVAHSLGARVIRLAQNLGFGAANNRGFRESRSPYVAFLNPDVTPKPRDLPTLAKFLDGHPNSLVAPQLVHDSGTPQPNGRGAPILWHKVMHRIRPSLLDGSYRLVASRGEVATADWLTGAVVAGKRAHLDRLGPWDEHFFVYYEDTDLGVRNAKTGGQSYVMGDCTWVHGWARETARFAPTAWRLELQSMLRFYRRYPHFLAPSLPISGRTQSVVDAR